MTESGVTAELSTSSEATRTLTTLSASANTALAWVPNPGVWQFDPPEPAFELELNLQPMSLDSAMLGTALDRMGSVSQMTGLGSQELAYALSGPSGGYSATSDVAHPEVVSLGASSSPSFAAQFSSSPTEAASSVSPAESLSHSFPATRSSSRSATPAAHPEVLSSGTSSSPSFAAQSSSSPTEAALSVSPAESLSHSFPATRSSSRSATPAVTSATIPPLLVSSARRSSLPSHQELNSAVDSADIAPPSITVASANVDTGPACKHHQGRRRAVPAIPAATETVNASREDGALAAKSGRPARIRVAPKQANAHWSRSGKQQPIVTAGPENQPSKPPISHRGKRVAEGQYGGPPLKKKK
ncbi:hypothetical protein SCP_1702940 [Sparassis crispa]|uniref:Uncharacterized protein n=1 Tax=Sparassis crispa TaxID=139825 RepID=A0A401H698_9APHY|nr:hypothetical protein SCP_1702940 [Sparassis crispa]GBE89968.1 hypothetical protein SCP_1702940 [Sparassis crispa]